VGTTFWFELPLEQADRDELALQAERRSISAASDDGNIESVAVGSD
jgi:two-component system sensor histidine kinase NblS